MSYVDKGTEFIIGSHSCTVDKCRTFYDVETGRWYWEPVVVVRVKRKKKERRVEARKEREAEEV